MTSAELGGSKGRFRIFVDGREQSVDQSQLTGVEIWALFGLDPNMELVVEGVGYDGADRVLEANGAVDLDADRPTHVFSRPPTNFGCRMLHSRLQLEGWTITGLCEAPCERLPSLHLDDDLALGSAAVNVLGRVVGRFEREHLVNDGVDRPPLLPAC